MGTNAALVGISLSLLTFGGILLFMEVGFRLGRKWRATHPATANEGVGTVDAAVFGLLGLTIAFTFGGASNRLDIRRAQIVQEANTIGTAYYRIDLLPAAEQPALRGLFRQYLAARIELYENFLDRAASTAALDRTNRLQKEIWTRSVAASGPDTRPGTALLVLPALNEMFDITTTRTMASVMHAPEIILVLLMVLSFLGAMLAGYMLSAQADRNYFHMILFALAISSTIYVVMDLEYPRAGLITLNSLDQAILNLQQMMK